MSDSNRVEVTKIVVAMGDQDIEMTLPAARRLFEQLEELFGTKATIVERPYPIRPYQPIIIEQPESPGRGEPWRPYPNRPWLTCQNAGDETVLRLDMNATA